MNNISLMKQACLLCDRATCGYKVGCLAVKNGQILLEAWNETLPGEMYCQHGFCDRQKLGLTGGKQAEIGCAIHAELNLIAKAASKGLNLTDSDIYVTTFPCYICSRALVQARVKKVFYMSDYAGSDGGRRFFEVADIPIEQLKEDEVWST